MSLTNKLISRFKDQKIILASLSIYNRITPLQIEFEPNTITINNLEEDLPPSIRLWRDRTKVEASSDRVKWIEVDEDEGKELQIYRLFDPVFLLPHFHITREIRSTPRTFLMEGSYNIEGLDFPSILFDYFKEEKNLQRWTRLQAFDDRLLRMSQQDFPPFTDTITLIFRRSPPYFW